MKDEALVKKIYETCHLTGRFILRSGQISETYFDKYQLESRPEILSAIAAEMERLIPPGTEVLAGLEMGGIPVATALSLLTGLPTLFVRKKPKDYGTCKAAEGLDFKGKHVTIVEDVVTTGGAIIEGAKILRRGGACVETVLCVIDREQGGSKNLQEQGLRLVPLLTSSELERTAQ
jgi:orotate phosphoribosyltransferase